MYALRTTRPSILIAAVLAAACVGPWSIAADRLLHALVRQLGAKSVTGIRGEPAMKAHSPHPRFDSHTDDASLASRAGWTLHELPDF